MTKHIFICSIKVAFYCNFFKNGGIQRVISLLINNISKEKKFAFYLITKYGKLEGEYSLPKNTKRIILSKNNISLSEAVRINHIDILIYNFYHKPTIKELNKIKSTKIIYYDHSSFFYWIYKNITNFKDTVYSEYKKCKYIISLIPFENDYLFEKWGINSILMDNPTTFEFNMVIPSDLTKNNIIMIGRASDLLKRFYLGIKSMEIIIKEIPSCIMNIVSYPEKNCKKLIEYLKLEKNVKFVGYQKNIEIFLKNSSLHILTSISEAYPMVLGETKIFGIPSIIIGLDYLTLSKNGTVIIYDDNPNIIAREAINILKNSSYRKHLGMQARLSMKGYKNSIIAKKWVRLLLLVYKGKKQTLLKKLLNKKIITKNEAENILNNQLTLLKKRRPFYRKVTLEKLMNYTFT
jgi:glycosyltransferase involved in cell wall biosynthesis